MRPKMAVDTALDIRGGDPATTARAAEAAGYDRVWASEIAHDPFLRLAVAASATTTIGLATGIAVAFARNPMTTAILANDLQALSGGRFTLGIGTQVRAHITRRFSMPWSYPAARMREYVLAMREIWASWDDGGRLDFAGDYYTHTLMSPMFVPPKHAYGAPPVIVAAVGEVMAEVAGEVGDGMLCHSFITPHYLREHILPALERGRRRSARPRLELVGGPFVATGETTQEIELAIAAVRQQLAFYASTPSYRPVLAAHGLGDLGDRLHDLSRAGEWERMARELPDEVLHEMAAVGTPEETADLLWTRYGDMVDRFVLTTPYDLGDAARLRVAAGLRQHTDERLV